GDEFGRSQHGNNNAYAQDNEITWLDWNNADEELREFAYALGAMRREFGVLTELGRLTGQPNDGSDLPDVAWLTELGDPLSAGEWQEETRRAFTMMLRGSGAGRLAVFINANDHPRAFTLPERAGYEWRRRAAFEGRQSGTLAAGIISAPARSVLFYAEMPAGQAGDTAANSG
ncbi:MAG: glycogen debranching protein GlgX, partial [Rhizobiaceae bacterium]